MTARAAVLVPIWRDRDAGASLLLIRRAATGGRHPGQMAFPGGRYEPVVDATLLDTALRESEEEVGLSPSDVSVVGALAERRTYSSEFVVTPFVGWIPADYPFRAQQREVAAMVRTPLAVFGEHHRRRSIRREFRGRSVVMSGVEVGEDVVWGLTLDVIDELLRSNLLASVAP